jgi:transcriptional regulator with XRE-family HTH domain
VDVIASIGPRIKLLRTQRGLTLAALAEETGISISTLSRLESGGRKATLELLLPIAKALRVALDELVVAPTTGDPRVHGKPVELHGMTIIPLTPQSGGLQAFKNLITAGARGTPDQRTHEGYEWLYVLSGRLRLVLGEHDLVLTKGEAAEFDTRVPHWFGSADLKAVEFLSLFGPQGERMHVRAKPMKRS